MDNGASSYRRFRDNGDQNAFVEIIRDYKDGLILYLTSIVGDVQTAEELAEDTFSCLEPKSRETKEQAHSRLGFIRLAEILHSTGSGSIQNE